MRSWVASAWQADTLFGHLCWGLRYLHGAGALQDFLSGYEKGKPPLLVSNGFPGDFLPVPLLPVRPADTSLALDDQKKLYNRMKENRGIRFLSLADFNRVIQGKSPLLDQIPEKEYQRVTVKNQINRLTDTTGEEGSLFNFPERYYAVVSVYLKLDEGFLPLARELFNYIKQTGYGKRKSTGYGQIEDCVLEPFSGFEPPDNPNSFVSLSNFVPSPSDPLKGQWKTLTKYGKMGEEYSLEEHVFKKPLIMLEAGAVFYDSPVKERYGCLVKNLNNFYPETVQYALALPVPMLLPQPFI